MRCDHNRPNDRPINDTCVKYIDQLVDELYNKIESLEMKLENISAKGYDDSELVAEIDKLKKLKADIELLDKSFYTKTQSDSRFVTHKELMGYAQTSAHYTKRESDERYIDRYEILNYVPRCCYENDQEEIKAIIDDINVKLNKLIELIDPSSEFLDIIKQLDYEDTEIDNEYVSAVNQVDGKISVIRKPLPVYEAVGVAESLVKELAEGPVHKNNEAIAILNGDVEDEGSVKKTVADAISEANLDQYAKIEDLGDIASLNTVPVDKIEDFKDEVKQVKVDSANSADIADKAICDEQGRSIHDTYAEKAVTFTKDEVLNQDALVLAEAQQYADSLGSNYDESGAAEAVKDELTDIINKKVDKEDGKSLIDTAEIDRLANISDEANKVEASEVNGNIKIDGDDITVYAHPDKHTISEVDGLQDTLDTLQPKGDYAEKATTLAGYGISDAYTKEEASNQDAVILAEAQQYTKELIDKLPEQVDYTVEITENSKDETVAKTYVFTQNNKEIGIIKLAKELVVTSGAVKEVIEADVPYAGAKAGDKYIELLIANQDAPIYVPAKDLVDIYTAKGNAAEVQIAISNTNEISATLVVGGVTEDKLAQSVQIKLNKTWEEVGVAQSLVDELANGQVTANKEAIDAINDVDNGILKQAKNYTDELLKDYATKEEVANQDAVVLAEAEAYADTKDILIQEANQALADYKADNDQAVAKNTEVLAILQGDSETEGSVAKQISDAITDLKLPETYEPLGASQAALEEAAFQDVVVLAEAQGYTDTKVSELAEGAVKANTEDIAALKAIDHTAFASKTELSEVTAQVSTIGPRLEELEQVINGDESTPGIIETLENKVDKTEGKDLSSNDFTDALLDKLNNIESNANRYIHPEKHQISEIENLTKTLDGKQPAGNYAMRAELEAETIRAQEAEERNAHQLVTLVGDVEGDTTKSVREIAKEEAQAEVSTLIGAAPEALDSLEEVAQWIQNDESGTQVIISDLSNLKEKVDTGDKTVTDYVNDVVNAQAHVTESEMTSYVNQEIWLANSHAAENLFPIDSGNLYDLVSESGLPVNGLAVSTDGKLAVAIFGDATNLGTTTDIVALSNDGGKTWKSIKLPVSRNWRGVIFEDPATPATLYHDLFTIWSYGSELIEEDGKISEANDGVLLESNGGESWEIKASDTDDCWVGIVDYCASHALAGRTCYIHAATYLDGTARVWSTSSRGGNVFTDAVYTKVAITPPDYYGYVIFVAEDGTIREAEHYDTDIIEGSSSKLPKDNISHVMYIDNLGFVALSVSETNSCLLLGGSSGSNWESFDLGGPYNHITAFENKCLIWGSTRELRNKVMLFDGVSFDKWYENINYVDSLSFVGGQLCCSDSGQCFTTLSAEKKQNEQSIVDAIADNASSIATLQAKHLYVHSVFVSYKNTDSTGDGCFQFSTFLINSDSRPYTLTHNNGGSEPKHMNEEDAYDLYRFWKAISQSQLNPGGYPINTKEYPYTANGCMSIEFKTPLSIIQSVKTQLYKFSDDTWRRYLIISGSNMNSANLGTSVMKISCGTPEMNANGEDISNITDPIDLTADLENYTWQDFYIVDTISQIS